MTPRVISRNCLSVSVLGPPAATTFPGATSTTFGKRIRGTGIPGFDDVDPQFGPCPNCVGESLDAILVFFFDHLPFGIDVGDKGHPGQRGLPRD
jgi:hypothetical protein